MNLLVRPKAIIGECLSGYIQRVAEANCVEFHELWRLFLPGGAHYSQSSISSSIDLYPYTLFSIASFELMLSIVEGTLESLTFLPIYYKMGVSKNKIMHSRILSGLVEKHRKYCPECLKVIGIINLFGKLKRSIIVIFSIVSSSHMSFL